MKIQLSGILLALVMALTALGLSHAEGSVWDSLKAKTYQVDGKIISIAFNDEQSEMQVKVQSMVRPSEIETVKVCSFKNKDDIQSVEQTEKMNQLRQAFARGERVQLSYNSRFDRCLSMIHNAKNNNVAADDKSI